MDGVAKWFSLCYTNNSVGKLPKTGKTLQKLAEDCQNYKIFSIVKKFLRSGNLETRTGRGRAFDPSLTINEAKPFCYLIFCFTPSPALRQTQIILFWYFFPFLLVRNILCQKGRFICEQLSFTFYYHLEIVCICIT